MEERKEAKRGREGRKVEVSEGGREGDKDKIREGLRKD